MILRAWALVVMLAGLAAHAAAADSSPANWREDFDTLEAWRPVTFPKIPIHTQYEVVKDGTNRILQAVARSSASAIACVRTFDVAQTPILHWRWQVQGLLSGGKTGGKDADDYPLRVYVVFPYDPARVGLGLRMKYELARKWYGEYPPHSSLNYVWAGRDPGARVFPSPYTDRSRMVVLRSGSADLGRWVEEQVDVLADYRASFGEDPPPRATLAIMSDTDNAGGSATGRVDYIEILDQPAPILSSKRPGGI